jgi:hypothetical protein
MTGASDDPKRGQGFDHIRSTMRGHQRPDIAVGEAVCSIHTEIATYGLDGEGYCIYVVAPDGTSPPGAIRCRGAQYVACFDRTSAEGITAEIRVGARALFVGRGSGTRLALLRTGPILRVELATDVEFASEEAAPSAKPPAAPLEPPTVGADPSGDEWVVDMRKSQLGLPVVDLSKATE